MQDRRSSVGQRAWMPSQVFKSSWGLPEKGSAGKGIASGVVCCATYASLSVWHSPIVVSEGRAGVVLLRM